MAGRRRAVGTVGALRSCRSGATDCVRKLRELADDAGGCGTPGIGDPGGAGCGTRPAHPENTDRELTVVGLRWCGRITVREVRHEHAPDLEAGGIGPAERDSHGYTSAGVRLRGL